MSIYFPMAFEVIVSLEAPPVAPGDGAASAFCDTALQATSSESSARPPPIGANWAVASEEEAHLKRQVFTRFQSFSHVFGKEDSMDFSCFLILNACKCRCLAPF